MKKIQYHIKKNDLENDSQYGFSKGKSLHMNILRYQNFIMEKLKNHPNSSAITLFIDYAKAFQRVSHTVLLNKQQDDPMSQRLSILEDAIFTISDKITKKEDPRLSQRLTSIANEVYTTFQPKPTLVDPEIQWQCQICTFNNKLADAKCKMCETSKGTPKRTQLAEVVVEPITKVGEPQKQEQLPEDLIQRL